MSSFEDATNPERALPLSTSRRELLLGAGLAAGAALTSSGAALASDYHPAGLYKPQEDAAGLQVTYIDAPAGLSNIAVGITANPRTWPIIAGSVKPKGAELGVWTGAPGELFYKQLKTGAFDISEMSTSFLMIGSMTGDTRFVPIPVFTSRYFFHSTILVRKGSGIAHPVDLKGRRVGVPEYMMTGAMWTKGVLQDEFGVHPRDIDWWVERLPGGSQGKMVGRSIGSDIRINQIPAEKNVGTMMLSGELDAAVMYIWAHKPTAEVRSTINLYDRPEITTLFPDPRAENIRYYRKTGIFHINHCAVVKRETLARAPGLAKFAFDLFRASNTVADAMRAEAVEYYYDAGMVDPASNEHLAAQLTPYGYAANQKTLDALARYSHDQGLTPSLVDMRSFFSAVG
jgi:4,5-dihydroxyphthalate decarboxylase